MATMTPAAPPSPAGSADLAAGSASIPALVFEQARRHAEREYLRHFRDGEWRSLTWAEAAESARRIGEGLVAAGLKPGDRIAILSENRVEWLLCDLGIQSAGCVTVPIYPSSQARAVKHILDDSRSRMVIVSGPDLAQKVEASPGLTVVKIDDQVAAWTGVTAPELRAEVERRTEALRPEDLATVIYTSGTTGEPKGVMLTHSNFLQAAHAALQVFDFGPSDTLLSFLPYSHVLERVDGVFTPTVAGSSIALARSTETLVEDIQLVRPTAMLGVPRVFEKIYEAVEDQVSRSSAVKRALFRWALDVGVRRLDPKAGAGLRAQARLADRLVLAPLRRKLTGGRLRFFISGGAPLNQKVEEFFWAMGVMIFQGWGMTETTSGATSNTETHHRYRTVGLPLPGVELRIAADGEILVRGPILTSGYLNRPDATAEVLDGDGWLSTGDLGFLDADGYLTITDRKKDLIKTSGGKYIAPLPIEAKLEASRLVKATLVVGDGHPYAVALIIPDWAAVSQASGVSGDPGRLKQDPRVRAAIQRVVDGVNQDLASFETIKRFELLTHEFSVDADELTPTLKTKRRVIAKHFAGEIEALYAAPRT